MDKQINELGQNIRTWAKDRKIIPNSNLESQFIKLCEEFGKLSDAIRKNNQEVIIDSIGNMFVVATIIGGLINVNIEELELFQNEYYKTPEGINKSFLWLTNSLGDIGKYIARYKKDNIRLKLADLVNDLEAVANKYNTDLRLCVSTAYIKR